MDGGRKVGEREGWLERGRGRGKKGGMEGELSQYSVDELTR